MHDMCDQRELQNWTRRRVPPTGALEVIDQSHRRKHVVTSPTLNTFFSVHPLWVYPSLAPLLVCCAVADVVAFVVTDWGTDMLVAAGLFVVDGALDGCSEGLMSPLTVGEAFVAVAIVVSTGCDNVFGLLFPAEGIAAIDGGACDCCCDAEFVEAIVADGTVPAVDVAGSLEEVSSRLLAPWICLCKPLESEHRIEPTFTGSDPRFADELAEKVGPKVTVPCASLNA